MWPEYAIKTISRAKVVEYDYERNVAREIAVLSRVCHPGVARLLSSFRWRGDAYLVLEYAANGDLHSIVVADGALDTKATAFVLGSIVAALEAVHDAGFCFGDLKPENILFTGTGHVKVTDFGAARGITEATCAALRAAQRRTIADLRDGDWQPAPDDVHDGDRRDVPDLPLDDDPGADDDDRVEGTTLYLAPECVQGARPSTAADGILRARRCSKRPAHLRSGHSGASSTFVWRRAPVLPPKMTLQAGR